MAGPKSVKIRDARKTYGEVTALNSVSIDVGAGELVALLGSSGCGKTTLLRSVAGLNELDSGTIRIGDADVTHVPTRKRPIGMVFQSYALFPNMTITENITFPLRVRKRPAAERRQRTEELLELVGLTGKGGRYPNQLSGGQQQRVALARALAPEPAVLLLDEPLSALDALIRESLRDEIRRIQQTVGITMLYVTHDQTEAMAIADRVAVMSEGNIVECAEPMAIYDQPASRFAAEFVGSRNAIELPVDAKGNVSWGAAFTLPAPAGADRSVLAVFRPEDVRRSDNGQLKAVVDVPIFLGSTTRVYAHVEGTRIAADLPSRDAAGLEHGSIIALTLDPATVRLYPA
jgi:putative spermidine/putrescine transport system ATP-binding protein